MHLVLECYNLILTSLVLDQTEVNFSLSIRNSTVIFLGCREI